MCVMDLMALTRMNKSLSMRQAGKYLDVFISTQNTFCEARNSTDLL